jgi:hypothetical protein
MSHDRFFCVRFQESKDYPRYQIIIDCRKLAGFYRQLGIFGLQVGPDTSTFSTVEARLAVKSISRVQVRSALCAIENEFCFFVLYKQTAGKSSRDGQGKPKVDSRAEHPKIYDRMRRP